MEDSIPNRPGQLFHLPRRKPNCLCRTANLYVCTSTTRIIIANLPQYSTGHMQIGIHLREMSDGRHHPAAQFPTIQYLRTDTRQLIIRSISITGSRLAMYASLGHGKILVIWDWKSAQLLFVRQFLRSYYGGQISSTRVGVGRGTLQLCRVHR